ncbi:MAG: Asp-tRNA(Asn)/Glu-tRNA(Gln) amidotransferase subunit GatC [Sediminibacterium sp.]|jgi:aspartyl-tRNA(Asn)/glutamyl-tRNA(Gln) amidotransferase subunit C|nr:Asp-tRNA(Asn)/Glu-tRNA(Gln) amidotransferase subunit GatC [Chitinophagaceae bacterium]MCA6446763.1 Asp-tRNA(Asn)/Glu-tRNA(Gln) amidotransferase subunit GatC [Chitinophagaceae bacterium]
MEITKDMISKLQHLARLESNPDEAGLRADLEKMVIFIEKLNELNTQDVEPLLYMTDTPKALREDHPAAPIDPKIILSNAPVPDTRYFKVPTVIKK